MSDPRVSVVMTTYNRHTYLREAIGSVLRQTMPDFEFIIVNDGSTTEEVLELLSEAEGSDSRIKLVHQDNQGQAGAKNSGVRCASAPLIALMDDDDISHPDRLKAQTEYLDRNEELPSVSTSMTFIDEGGLECARSPKAIAAPVLSPKAPAFGEALEIVDKVIQNATIMARKAAWDEVDGYRAWFMHTEDVDLTLRFMERFALSKIPDRVYLYRKYHASDRISRGASWDYLAAAVLSFHSRLRGLPDPVPSASVDDVHEQLGELPGVGRRYLIRKARGTLRKCLQDGNRERFEDVWSRCSRLVQDEEDRTVLQRIRRRVGFWQIRYLRLWGLG